MAVWKRPRKNFQQNVVASAYIGLTAVGLVYGAVGAGKLAVSLATAGGATATTTGRGVTTAVCADNDCTNEAQAAVQVVERLPVPSIPSTVKNVSEFGNSLMRWGTGSESARARIQTITREELTKGGMTQEMARAWRDFYINEMARNPSNPSAAGRADLMEHVVKLLTENQ